MTVWLFYDKRRYKNSVYKLRLGDDYQNITSSFISVSLAMRMKKKYNENWFFFLRML